jgi:hypothetical protein
VEGGKSKRGRLTSTQCLQTGSAKNETNANDTASNDERLMSVDQFVNFLNHEQRDPRLNEILYPYVDRVKGREIIAQHEPNKTYAQRGE